MKKTSIDNPFKGKYYVIYIPFILNYVELVFCKTKLFRNLFVSKHETFKLLLNKKVTPKEAMLELSIKGLKLKSYYVTEE